MGSVPGSLGFGSDVLLDPHSPILSHVCFQLFLMVQLYIIAQMTLSCSVEQHIITSSFRINCVLIIVSINMLVIADKNQTNAIRC